MTAALGTDARAIAIDASDHALRLGHPYLGGEHFLLALAGADQPAGAVLREHGVTPERVEAEIVRLAGGGLFGDLDRDALAAVGVDTDAVRATAEAAFGREALARAARTGRRESVWSGLRPRSGAQRNGVFLPHGPGAVQALFGARYAVQARQATGAASADDFALGILAIDEGLVPAILSALGVSGPALTTAILAR